MSIKFFEPFKSLLLRVGKKNKQIQIVIFLAILTPVTMLGVLGYFKTYDTLTELTLSRRQSIADLAASVLEQKFDRLTDVGVSLATRVRFRELLSAGKWDDAIQILSGIQTDFPSIERVFVTDPSGTLMADLPALPGVRGRNFAHRDWYQGVSSQWRPYVSEVYKRAAEPQYNVIAVSVPIQKETEIIGILVLQVRLGALVDWSKSVGAGFSGFIYFVDKKGRLAAHPKIPLQSDLIDYSSVPVVQKVIRGQSGVEVTFNPLQNEEQLSAYAQVPGIGWGVIATESTHTAFQKRDEDLSQLLIRYGLILLISTTLALAIVHVLAARERAEEESRRIATLLDSVVEHNPVMIFLKDPKELRFTMINHAVEKTIGYSRQELIGKNNYDLFPAKEADRFTAADQEVLARMDLLDIPEERIQTRHHEERVLHTRKLALRDSNGEPQYLLGVSEDITERKRTEESVRKLNHQLQVQSARLEAANKELEAFSYSVSHDLRAPLRSIDGFSQALLEDYENKLDEEGKDYLRRVRASTQRMAELIDDLLKLSRVSRGELHLETVDISAMARTIAAELQRSEPERHAELVIADGMVARGDTGLLKAALENLIGNAWKFTAKRPSAKIEVGVTGNNGSSFYFVRDNGAGFDMTYADKLFGAFQRLHTDAEFKGTGIGLATVQRIVRRHGGRVWAESKVDKGAAFYFTLSAN